MIQQIINLNLPEGNFQAMASRAIYMQDCNSNRELTHTLDTLITIYNSWKDLNFCLRGIGSRGVNIPEGLTEGLFCYLTGAYRTNNLNITGCNTSFDCYLPSITPNQLGTRYQIKACSVIPDLTSFGPHSIWDKLIFIDFSDPDGNFSMYEIPSNIIYNYVVNTRRNQTFVMQQQQGRRPRLSLYRIVIDNNIQPFINGNIYELNRV